MMGNGFGPGGRTSLVELGLDLLLFANELKAWIVIQKKKRRHSPIQ